MAKAKDYRIFMLSPDGGANRTIELRAEDEDEARRRAERQADDIAEQEFQQAVDAFAAEHEIDKAEAAKRVMRVKPYKVSTVEKI